MAQWSMVQYLLAINAVVFLLGMILGGSSRGAWISPHQWGDFSIGDGIFRLQIWRWVTYQFLHRDFFHLLFNMMGLYFFGPLMERWWGSRRFLAFYLICGLGAASLYTVLAFVPGLLDVSAHTGLIGASGCIFGILVGCAVLYPDQQVMLMIPPIPMKMKTITMLFLGIAMFSLIAGSTNAGGEAAHLGGAAIGWWLIKRPSLLSSIDRMSLTQVREGFAQTRRQSILKEDVEVDRILGKVRAKGLASLNSREKKILQRATDRHRDV